MIYIDSLEIRWDWFSRLLETLETTTQDVIPARWCFGKYLYKEFTDRTTKHVVALLTGRIVIIHIIFYLFDLAVYNIYLLKSSYYTT